LRAKSRPCSLEHRPTCFRNRLSLHHCAWHRRAQYADLAVRPRTWRYTCITNKLAVQAAAGWAYTGFRHVSRRRNRLNTASDGCDSASHERSCSAVDRLELDLFTEESIAECGCFTVQADALVSPSIAKSSTRPAFAGTHRRVALSRSHTTSASSL